MSKLEEYMENTFGSLMEAHWPVRDMSGLSVAAHDNQAILRWLATLSIARLNAREP
jgi:hypothetical protein